MATDRGEARRLARFFAIRALEGAMAGWAILLGLVWTDVGNLATLTRTSSDGTLAMVMLACVFGITFGAVGLATGVAALGSRR